jgi:hypothetical protein
VINLSALAHARSGRRVDWRTVATAPGRASLGAQLYIQLRAGSPARCSTHVRSERAGRRVMEGITRYVEQRLKLRVNRDKFRG